MVVRKSIIAGKVGIIMLEPVGNNVFLLRGVEISIRAQV